MQNKQFYTMKFKSSRLKEFNYDISITFDEAKEYGEIIALFDNQILRSIRDIHDRHGINEQLDQLKRERDVLKRKEHSDENAKLIKEVEDKINNLLFIPEYITIVMDHSSHYKHLYNKKLRINGNTYRRFSCSAGQARVSTVGFCEEETAVKLDLILDNGRDLDKELVPSKLNAYKGLAGSATSTVSTPRFCLVPDYHSDSKVKVNFVTETGLNDDDEIEIREITESFNRFDGQGLISYEMAVKWADELGLDYVPAQWCVRQNYIKGMLNTFPIHEFCEKVNNGNTKIKTSYTDENGNPKMVDLTDIDVILSDSQFKLWDSFDSIETYQENCENNNLQWGVSLHSPKKDKDILRMNYQFLQTLDLDKMDIETICKKFVNWITGVSSEDIYYTLLFLLGTEITEDKIDGFLSKSDKYWIKALMVNHELINDKYIKKKIYDLIRNKIKNGCLGQIIIDGNFQTLVSDPYAMMQHVCGLEVTGILGKNEYYSNYWNEKGIKVVDSMRAPLTYRSEHLLLNLKKNKEVDYWYRHNYTGIIVNAHGSETMNWAGSDFDYDIIATTSDPTVIKRVYQNELPVVYEAPKSEKKKLTDEDLFNADLFSFGSAIGSITNKSTSGYALLPLLDQGSDEWKVTMNRIKMCTKLQSAQIDKAKIGREVKGIPKSWVNFHRINKDDSDEERENKEFLNSILLDKHPYFFTYLYKGTKNKYKKYINGHDITCKQRFGMSIDELKKLNRKTQNHREFLQMVDKYSPVLDSDCVMNNLCRYIESIDFGIKRVVNTDHPPKLYRLLMSDGLIEFDDDKYAKIVKTYNKYKKTINQLMPVLSGKNSIRSGFDENIEKSIIGHYEKFQHQINDICSDVSEAVDYLIYLFYVEQPNSNKEALWSMYGAYLFENVTEKNDSKVLFPFPSDNGEITYLDKKYSLKEVLL